MTQSLRTQINKPHSSDWVQTRLSRVARFRNGSDYKHVEVDEPGFPVYGSGGQFRWSSEWLYDGDSVLFGRKGTINKPLFATGKFWTVDTMYFTEVNPGYLIPKFFYYWATRFPFDYYSTDTALPSITQSDLGSEPIWLPSLEEQRQIADHLDHETAEIDAFIHGQEQLHSLFKERLLSSITEKTSGAQYPRNQADSKWYPALPIDWKLARVKSVSNVITDGAHISPETEGGVFPFVSTRDVKNGLIDTRNCLLTTSDTANYMIKTGCQPLENDVLFSKDGTVGEVAVVSTEQPFVVASSLVIIRPNPKTVDSKYLSFSLRAKTVKEQASSVMKGAGLPRISVANVGRLEIALPPLSTQKIIVESLEDEINQTASVLEDTQALIRLSLERRAALVSAAVTGQIDVTAMNKPAAEQLEDDIAQGLHKES